MHRFSERAFDYKEGLDNRMISKSINSVFCDNHDCVSWNGISFLLGKDFTSFLHNQVRSRLDDEEGVESFQNHLRGLELTGMGKESLETLLAAGADENRDWVAGEALAEAYLMENEGIIFPWNMERDKRNPFGSLPGADLIGFVKDDHGYRLVLGEVKTSSEGKYPPRVMFGRSGMYHQIDSLACNMTTIYQLLRWLHHRTKGGMHELEFNQSCTRYFDSGNKSVVLFGVLVRDTVPNVIDLSVRGNALRNKLTQPTQCNLIALYLPWEADRLVSEIRLRGDQ